MFYSHIINLKEKKLKSFFEKIFKLHNLFNLKIYACMFFNMFMNILKI